MIKSSPGISLSEVLINAREKLYMRDRLPKATAEERMVWILNGRLDEILRVDALIEQKKDKPQDIKQRRSDVITVKFNILTGKMQDELKWQDAKDQQFAEAALKGDNSKARKICSKAKRSSSG